MGEKSYTFFNDLSEKTLATPPNKRTHQMFIRFIVFRHSKVERLIRLILYTDDTEYAINIGTLQNQYIKVQRIVRRRISHIYQLLVLKNKDSKIII
jgi:hypothetical protein